MKDFDNIEELSKYCENKKECDKKKIVKKYRDIIIKKYLTNAGYTNFEGVDIVNIFKELRDISSKIPVTDASPRYLKASDEEIMDHIIGYGSNELKNFLRNNGYIIIDIQKPLKNIRLKGIHPILAKQVDTILIRSKKEDDRRARGDSVSSSIRSSSTISG